MRQVLAMDVDGGGRVAVSVDDQQIEISVINTETRETVRRRRLPLARIAHFQEGQKRARTLRAERHLRVWPLNPASNGQNGPILALRPEELNENERRLFMVFDASDPKRIYTIRELARAAFPALSEEQAYNYARNQLRRLMRGHFLDKPENGKYKLSEVGLVYRQRAAETQR